MTIAPIQRVIELNVPAQRAFEVFTQQMGLWVPAEHSLLDGRARTVIIESQIGGAWYEIDARGNRKDWGRVMRWSPPTHLQLIWQLDHEFTFNPGLETMIDVQFEQISEQRTRLTFSHSGLEAYGEHAQDMRERFERPGAWSHWLEGLQQHTG